MEDENRVAKRQLRCPECGRFAGLAEAGSVIILTCRNQDCRAEIQFEVTGDAVNSSILKPSRLPQNEDINKYPYRRGRAGPKETK